MLRPLPTSSYFAHSPLLLQKKQVNRFAGVPEGHSPTVQRQAGANLLGGLVTRLKTLLGVLLSPFKRVWQALFNRKAKAVEEKPVNRENRVDIPRLIMTDAYNVGSSPFLSKEMNEKTVYHVTFRKRAPWMDVLDPDKKDNRFIFYGLHFILEDFFRKPITHEEIDEAVKFLKTAHADGGEYSFDEKLWRRVVDECGGILPIKIEALHNGAVGFIGEPMMQITAKEGFGELAGWFEAKLLQVFSTSERASMMRHWLDYNKNLVRYCTNETLPEDVVNRKAALRTHDFGDRASSCPQESERFSLAHLISGHLTSSTFQGVYRAWKEAGEKHVGGWIKSLAHRVVQGHKQEGDAYRALYESEKGKKRVTSHVDDLNNSDRAVDEYLVPLALEAKESGDIISARPDSGDILQQVAYTLGAAVNAGLEHPGMFKQVTTRDGKPLIAMTHLKTIAADEEDFKKMMAIDKALLELGFSPVDSIGYGVGGFLRDTVMRKNFSAKMSLAAVGKDNKPVMKFSMVPGKRSVPGVIKIVREGDKPSVRTLDEPGKNELVVWYDGIDGVSGKKGIVYDPKEEGFLAARKRVAEGWDQYRDTQPKHLFSEQIEQRIQTLFKENVQDSTYQRGRWFQNIARFPEAINKALLLRLLERKSESEVPELAV